MENFNKHYEDLFISSLFHIQERPGVYIGSPSFEKLLDVMTGYIIAIYDLTGYRIVFEQEFRKYLRQKYQKEEECSLRQFFQAEKSDAEAFEEFFRELKLFAA